MVDCIRTVACGELEPASGTGYPAGPSWEPRRAGLRPAQHLGRRGGTAFASDRRAAQSRAATLSEQSVDELVEQLGGAEARVGTNHNFDEEPRCDESASEEQKFADENAPSRVPFVQIGMPKHQPIVSQCGTGAKM